MADQKPGPSKLALEGSPFCQVGAVKRYRSSAATATKMFASVKADGIIAETNQGGNIVRFLGGDVLCLLADAAGIH